MSSLFPSLSTLGCLLSLSTLLFVLLPFLLLLFDFTQHYFKGNDKLLDLDYRMNILPGMKTDERQNLIRDLFKFISKITNNQKN